MSCSNSKERAKESWFCYLLKSNILSTPSAGQKGNCETKVASVRHKQTNFTRCTPNPPRNKYQPSLWCPWRNHLSPPPECAAPHTLQGFGKFDRKGWWGSPHWLHIPEPPHPESRRLTPPGPAVLSAKAQSVARFYHPKSLGDLTAAQYGQAAHAVRRQTVFSSSHTKPELQLPALRHFQKLELSMKLQVTSESFLTFASGAILKNEFFCSLMKSHWMFF